MMLQPSSTRPVLLLLALMTLAQHAPKVAAAPNRRLLQTPSDVPPQLPFPASPYSNNCPPTTQPDDIYVPFSVDGYPSSGTRIKPFQAYYKDPEDLVYTATASRADEQLFPPNLRTPKHLMKGAEITIKEFEGDTFFKVSNYCKKLNKKTWWMGYNGMVPGPTIRMPVGTETLIRFKNVLNGSHFSLGSFPCDGKNGRGIGRPVSIHLHGSPTLPPYDGWADDMTCSGESKDYIYPNNKPSTMWYHDHALHETARNAYSGLAGFYVTDDSASNAGGCGGPMNLDTVEQRHFMFGDKVLDKNCQLFFDAGKGGAHEISLFGDYNLVSGQPWPVMSFEPKWYRFRLLNGGPSRPYKIQIRDAKGAANIAPNFCWVIATDEFYKQPTKFPADGMFIGVAERYEIVCDMEYALYHYGPTLYLWNDRDDKRMINVPYFCYSHLFARMDIAATKNNATKYPGPFMVNKDVPARPDQVQISDAEMAQALARARKGDPDRDFQFGRCNGQWCINGETWDTDKFAAKDVAQNSWELWRLQAGGGWFHPVHIHLLSFFVILRNDKDPFSYEMLGSKDVVYLGPGEKIYVVARWGPHRGDYMFHCHNLIHEDDDMLRAFKVTLNSTQNKPGLGHTAPYIVLNEGVKKIYSDFAYNNPMYNGSAAKPTNEVNWPNITDSYLQGKLDLFLHRIFWPKLPYDDLVTGGLLNKKVNNPWIADCPEWIPSV